MTLSTYSDYQGIEASEKLGLVILEAAQRLMGWVVHSGSVYKIPFSYQSIVSLEDSGVALSEVSTTSLSAGEYYLDRSAGYLYARTSDSANPNGKFLACVFRLYFASGSVTAPHDLSTGYEVEWLPLFKPSQGFTSELDNQNLLGFAIEGSGNLTFLNDQEFWAPKFDRLYFENQRAMVYSWHRDLAITQAKLLFRGRVQTKEWDATKVRFGCKDLMNELRAPVPVSDMSDYGGALIPPSMNTAKQRLLYGYLKGLVPTNITQELELTGYTITGTLTATSGSKTLTGSGTSFLAQLTPGDELLLGSDTTWYTVDTVTSDTAATLTENYGGTTAAGKSIRLKSSHPKRYMNRIHLIAGHALKEPATTVVYGVSLQRLEVASTSDFLPGDKVLVGSEIMTVDYVTGAYVQFTGTLVSMPSVGSTITNLSIKNVYLNDRLLTYSRDYTYNAATALITLDSTAEFNVAPVKILTPGTLSFTNTSRTVTGTSTTLKKDVKPGDWVRRQGQSDWFEVLTVDSETQLTLRTAATYTSSGTSELKQPEVYKPGSVVLSLDCLGATENGVKTGTFIKTGAQVVKDLLTRAGLSASINTSAFTTAQGDSVHKLGIALPPKVNDTKVASIRDVINRINLSIFGSLFVGEDFELEYSILSPKKPAGLLALVERDVLELSVTSDSSKIVKTSRVRYNRKEYDSASGTSDVYSEATKTSDMTEYLGKTTKENLVETYLVDDTEAQIIANRWSFLLELASSVVKVRTKMQAIRSAVNDKVEVSHEKLYDRLGSSVGRKVAGVQSISRSVGGTELELSDLSNAFSRCLIIAPNSSAEYASASDDEKLYNGYITDTYGMQDNDPDTHGTNVIW